MGHYVVLDLEMCWVPKANRRKEYYRGDEIIEIGAVLLNDDYEIIDEYKKYVLPQYGKLTSFITGLTGITFADIKDAPCFKEAFDDFASWIPEDAVLVTWSDNDTNLLRYEGRVKGTSDELIEKICADAIDCQKIFGEKIHISHSYKLEEALNISDVIQEGRLHDGLDDAKNTALLFKKLMQNEVLEFNPVYVEAQREEVTHLGCPLGSLISELNIQVA